MPVRTSSPSSSPPGTKSAAWPGRTRPRQEGAADSDGVIHVAHRQDLLPSGGIDAVAAAELPVMLAYGEACRPALRCSATLRMRSACSPGNCARTGSSGVIHQVRPRLQLDIMSLIGKKLLRVASDESARTR